MADIIDPKLYSRMFAEIVSDASNHDQAEALDRLGADIHASVVNEDGTVRNIDRSPSPFWKNNAQR